MRDCNQGRFQQQIRFLRRQFLQDGGLPFSRVLSEEMVEQALSAVNFVWNDSIYTPMVTLWVFLSQVLSADHSCNAAVARLIAHRVRVKTKLANGAGNVSPIELPRIVFDPQRPIDVVGHQSFDTALIPQSLFDQRQLLRAVERGNVKQGSRGRRFEHVSPVPAE